KQQELLDELKTGADVVFWWRPSGRIDLSRLLAAPNQRAPLVVIHDANRSDASAVALAEDAIVLSDSNLGRLGAAVARALAERRASLEGATLERHAQTATTLAATGHLTLGLARDVCNIITAIQRSVSVLLQPPSEQAILAEAQLIDQACGSLVDLARQLLSLG